MRKFYHVLLLLLASLQIFAQGGSFSSETGQTTPLKGSENISQNDIKSENGRTDFTLRPILNGTSSNGHIAGMTHELLSGLLSKPLLLQGQNAAGPNGNRIRPRDILSEPPFDPGFGDNISLYALLSGGDEVPAVTTDAVGLATLYFNGDKHTATVNITATGLSGPITGVHIHEADFGMNGPVIFPLTNEGNRIHNEITNLTDLDLVSLLNGATYVNIHTDAHPAGEIRGQLALDQDLTFVATMTGDDEAPAVTTDGLGLASIHWTLGRAELEVNVQLTNLSSEITGAHLHSGPVGQNGPVIVDLTDLIQGNIISGNVDITAEALANLLIGDIYINVHTLDNPAGEIRGQLTYLPGICFDGWMSSMQEVPSNGSEATGLAVGTAYPTLNDLAIWMLVDKATGPINNAHFHSASLGANGPVVYDLSDDLNDNFLVHLGSLPDGVLSDILSGGIYINAHTDAHPGGELRGQLFRLARDAYNFDLCTTQEVGTIDAPMATGSASMSIDRLHSNANLFVVADGLTGDLTASHIHLGDIGMNGPVLTDLTSFYSGNEAVLYAANADTALLNPIRAGKTYLNIHTAQHPAGEIRGQIVKDQLCSLNVGIEPLSDLVDEVQLSPVPVVDELSVSLDVLQPGRYSFAVVDLTGRILLQKSADFFAGENLMYLPTDLLAQGFYTLTISNGRAMQGYKFVK